MSSPFPAGGTSLRYRPEIDGLRAIAVIPVILYHAGFELFRGGFVGVDVFFVISGYLITSLILTEMDAGRFSLAHFYERRARRILPALFCVTTVSIPFAIIWLSPGDLVSFARSIIAVSLFSSNILFWRESGYFDTVAELKPLIHTWSLAVEEQYYILFPLLLLFMFRAGRRRLFLLLSTLAAVSLGTAQWAAYTHPTAAFYLLPTRAWEILLGALLALRRGKPGSERPSRLTMNIASVAGLFMIAASVRAFDRQTPFPSVFALAPTVGTALAIAFARPGTFAHRLLSSRLLVAIGLMSYSLYLWHQPVFAFTKHLTSYTPSPLLMGGLSLAVFPMSYLTWRLVEIPFRAKKNFSRRQIFSLAAASAVISISVGIGIQTSSSLQDRFQKLAYGGDVDHQEFNRFLESHYTVCKGDSLAEKALKWKSLTRCLQSKERDEVDLALIGDSHAEHLFIGLAENLKSSNVAYYIQDSLPVASNPAFEAIYAHVLSSPSIRTVIIAAHWFSGVRQVPPEEMSRELLRSADALIASGKVVYLADDVPMFPFGPEMCKWIRWPLDETTCEIKASFDQSFVSKYEPALQEVLNANPAIQPLELHRYLCDERGCSMVQDGLLLFRDHNHLNIDGSMWIASKILADHPELSDQAEQ